MKAGDVAQSLAALLSSQVTLALLTLLSVIAAALATKYARDSARAAKDAVEPLQQMEARLGESVAALTALQGSQAQLVGDISNLLTTTERIRREDRLVRELAQFERVISAVQQIWEGLRRLQHSMPDIYLREGIAELRAALAPVPPEQLPECRSLAEQMITDAIGNQLAAADREIRAAVHEAHAELNSVRPP
jgi:ABC-type multidrug transport system fused ATPase/permease subunit